MDHLEFLKAAGSKGGKAAKGALKRRSKAHYARLTKLAEAGRSRKAKLRRLEVGGIQGS